MLTYILNYSFEQKCHIHAYVCVNIWNTLVVKIEEGELYIISNFHAKEALGSLKPVSSRNIMNFPPSTTVEKIEENDFMIPNHKFEFVDLGDLSAIVTSYTNPEYPEFFVGTWLFKYHSCYGIMYVF